MVARGSTSVHLCCALRRASIPPLHAKATASRGLQTVLDNSERDDFLLTSPPAEITLTTGRRSLVKAGVQSWTLCGAPSAALDTALSFDALCEHRDVRTETLRSLSKPPSSPLPSSQEREASVGSARTSSKSISAGIPIPHAKFRELMGLKQYPKAIRQVLRNQLLQCERPKDVLRVVAVAFMDVKNAEQLATLTTPLMRAVYRCRINVTDPEILTLLMTIITRFRHADLALHPTLLFLALKFAARSRTLSGMKRILKTVRQDGLVMTSHVFRSVIAKCSIGRRGLGEIRNGRWRRGELLEVLKGFKDAEHLPADQQYHLGSFLVQDNWHFLHGWIAVLARCRDSETLWKEWLHWKCSDARKKPRLLAICDHGYRNVRNGVTTRIRGDYWFVEQMSYTGDAKKAWQIFRDTEVEFAYLKTVAKDCMLSGIEHATVWNAQTRAEMIDKYDRELTRIEGILGVRWRPGEVDGEGIHELVEDQEAVLARLGDEGWEPDPEYGFPYDDSQIVPDTDRMLHDAVESNECF